MKLVEETHPILMQKCDLFDFENPIMDPYELSDGLHKIRKDGRGVGLAAPQVGLNTQALVIGMGNFKTEGIQEFEQVLFNPDITEYSEDTILMIEGCLSYPGLFLKVKRPESIVLTWYSEEGSKCYQQFGGMTGRILQHEIDHLKGITFQKRANRFHLNQAQKGRKYLSRRRKRNEEN